MHDKYYYQSPIGTLEIIEANARITGVRLLTNQALIPETKGGPCYWAGEY